MRLSSRLFMLPAFLVLSIPLWADIIVVTYLDKNNNGLRETTEPLIAGLQVTATDSYGDELVFLDNAQGNFLLPGAVIRSRLRIVVTGYNPRLQAGKNNPTTVFFGSDGDSFEIPVLTETPLDPQSTNILIPCYEKGASLLKKDSPAFVHFPFASRGIAAMFGGNGPDPVADASISQLGSTWGVTYQRSYQRAFAASILKRHVGLGPQGLGAIYTLDYRTPKPTIAYFNLQDIMPSVGPMIDLGTIQREIVDVEIDETMPYALSTIEDRVRRASYDIDAFDKVGKTSYGDIELAEDGRTLWMVNAHQRSLISMDVDSDTIVPSQTTVKHFPIDSLPGIPNLFFRFRTCINVGGNANANGSEAFTDANRVAWDKNKYSLGGQAGFSNEAVDNTLNPLENTSSRELYQTYRKGDFSYNIPVPLDEAYEVKLHFFEPENFIEGERLFDIMQGDQVIFENFDIVKYAGGAKKATVLKLNLNSDNKFLNLKFVSKFGTKRKEALLSGVEISGQTISESGILRAWALTFHQGKGYLGVVSDASYSQSREHLFAYVLSFNPDNVLAGFTEELAFPLNYPRERASNAQLNTPQPLRSAAWMPWISAWDETMIPTEGEPLSVQGGLLCAYAQPMFSEITFTSDGSMVLGFMDRWAHQTGHLNYSTNLGDRTLLIGYAAGDLLKAFKESNGFILEKENSDDGVYYRKDDGPSYSGEFFYEDNFISPLAHHGEIITGGQDILPGSDEIAVTVHSPILTKLPFFQYDGLLTQGLHFYNVKTGRRTGEYLFVEQFVLGKANGLGDLTIAVDAAPPAVGNYVWCDANSNGVQDPTEYGIDDIQVSLHDAENALIPLEQKVTFNGGQFYFDNLLPNHQYELRIELDELINSGYSGGVSPPYGLDSLIDSDGDDIALPGYSVIEFFTGNDGLNRDDLDFGFLGPLATNAQKVLCEDVAIPPFNLPCADFLLSELRSCVTSITANTVQLFPTFNDAEDQINEIVTDVRVCDVDSIVYARVAVAGDPNCFAISEIHLMVQPGAGGLVVDFVELVCPMDPFNALQFLQDQGFRGDATTEFFTDPARTSPYLGDPTAINPASFPFTLYYDDTIVDGGCGVPGSIMMTAIPATEIFAGNDTSLCGIDCIDLTLLQPYFYANGTGATEAFWTTSGNGIFLEDSTFANAHFYCPAESDIDNGQVILTLTVADDPCVSPAPSSSVTITLTAGTPSFLEHPRDTVDCYHPFAMDPEAYDTFPGCQLVLECIDTLDGEVIEYEVLLGDCFDIIKEIKRTLKFTHEKQEFFCMDTIAIRALPDTLICPPMRDSVYCVPGYLKDENGHPSPLETGVPMAGTIPLWPQLPSECDVQVHYYDVEFKGLCPTTIRRDWYIKNNCTGSFDSCAQWIMIFDTTGPVITKLDTAAFNIPVAISSHDCFAEVYVPKIMVEDTCVGVKQVKATVGTQTVLLTYNPISGYYESHVKVKVPISEVDLASESFNSSLVSYEAIDSCHNLTRLDSLPLLIIDNIRPVTICDKGLNITVRDSIEWVHAESFNEGSWDNCGISLLLARRSDWATACGMNLCDDIRYLFAGEHHDSVWYAQLETDKHLNPVEAHYQQTIDWLCRDAKPCSYPFMIGWFYDLVKYGTIDCIQRPYPVSSEYIYGLLTDNYGDASLTDLYQSLLLSVLPCIKPVDPDSLYLEYVTFFENPSNQALLESLYRDLLTLSLTNRLQSGHALFDLGKQIGGGWSDAVPFCCEDACQNVMVELLAMDYWCNWSKCWTMVTVEDKTPPQVVSELSDASITCGAYNTYYAPAVKLALEGNFDSLQHLLGTYDKVTGDSYGQLPDKSKFALYDLICDSMLVEKDTLVYDEHLGYIWKKYSYYQAEYDVKTYDRFNGQVADNCGLQCIEERPWISLDACGNGFVKRVFKFVGLCSSQPSGHFADTITRFQTIWVTSDCPISKAMFEAPQDTVIYGCGIEYSEDGSGTVGGALSPQFTGEAKYLFDNDCRQVGIGYYDKVFKIVGGNEACYKVLRTWCFADWCTLEYPIEKSWWFSDKYQGKYLTCTQKIIVYDSVAPICTIAEIPGVIEASSCSYDLNTVVVVEDECGILRYHWQLIDTKSNSTEDLGSGEVENSQTGAFVISSAGINPGSYHLKVKVTDECQNESLCETNFVILASKKPTPVCITSLTAELTPMDLVGNGVIDTAMAVVWASEFDRSSQAPCGGEDSKLKFLIDRAVGDPALPEVSAASLNFGCDDLGLNEVRLYVLDETGSWDYCTAMVIVQNNMGGCDSDIANGVVSGTILTENSRTIDLVEMSVRMGDDGPIVQIPVADGAYLYEVPLLNKVTLWPGKNTDFTNGVSTLDLVHIQKEILGKDGLSWYQMQAADANNDGKVSAADLIQLRKLILGKIDTLPGTASWRFFDRHTKQEKYVIESMPTEANVDFIGVKIGDVNGDNDPARRAGRSATMLTFILEDRILEVENNYRIAFQASDFKEIKGFQFTILSQPSIEIIGWEAGAIPISEDHFYRSPSGFSTMSWHHPDDRSISVEDGVPLFYLNVKVSEKKSLSDGITVNNDRIAAEAYQHDNIRDLAIDFVEADSRTREFLLLQNQPNPFRMETSIGFYLPEAGKALLTIYEISGRILKSIEIDANQGYNVWITNDFPSALPSSLLYYKLETQGMTAVKKMVLIR